MRRDLCPHEVGALLKACVNGCNWQVEPRGLVCPCSSQVRGVLLLTYSCSMIELLKTEVLIGSVVGVDLIHAVLRLLSCFRMF